MSEQGLKSNKLAIAVSSALFATTQIPEATAQSEVALTEEIIVTATRRGMSVHDIPFNISAISGEDIKSANLQDSQELLRQMPGIVVPDSGARLAENNNIITIRGLNVNPASTDRAFLSDPTVSTYVGDTPIYANFLLRDLERVEVLRGPQGTLYGSGSLGGTVRFIPNKPSTEGFSADINLGASITDGSDGQNLQGDVTINVPLTNSFAVRLNAGKIENDGVVDYTNVYQYDTSRTPEAEMGDVASGMPVYTNHKDADTVDIDHLRFAARFTPSDQLEIMYTYMNQEGSFGGRRQVTSALDGWGDAYDEYEVGSVLPEPADSSSQAHSIEMSYEFGFAILSASVSSYDRSYDAVSDNTGFFAAKGWIYWYGYGNYPRPAFAADRQNSQEADVAEIRLVSNTDSKVDWTVGMFYMDQSGASAQQTHALGLLDWLSNVDPDGDGLDDSGNYVGGWYDRSTDVTFDWTYDQKFKDLAVFGELTYHINEDLNVTFGARSFSNEHTVTSQTAFPIWFVQNPIINETNKDDDVLFKGNLSWDLDDQSMLYATISEGYRRGGTNAAPVRPDPSYPNDPEWNSFDSDTVVNYELGIKGGTEQYNYNTALFYVDWNDPQLNVATPSGAYYAVANGSSARTFGLESEFRYNFNDFFELSGGYTYVSAELTDDLMLHDASDLTVGKSELRATEGAKLPGTPEHTFNVALSHTMRISCYDLVSRIDGYYQSEVENSILNIDPDWAQTLDGFGLVNLSVSLASENWRVTGYAKNILNEKGTTATYKEEYMQSDPSMFFYGNGQKDFITTPRTLGINLSYSF